jgi:pimeloyl-ACP methyl ester carboxylesterase
MPLGRPINGSRMTMMRCSTGDRGEIGFVGIPQGLIRLLQVARDPQLTDKIGQLTCPVLVVYGEQDKFVAPQLNRDLARSIPTSEIVMIPDAGHAVVMEKPGLIASLVHGFVGRFS